MEYKTPDEDNNRPNGAGASDGVKRKMRLRVFRSFDEAAEAEAMDDALQPPAERLRETVELILRVYGVTREQLKARDKKLHITIGRIE